MRTFHTGHPRGPYEAMASMRDPIRLTLRPETTCQLEAGSLPEQIERTRHALNARQVAEFLAISPITVYKLAKGGKLPSLRIGRSPVRSASSGAVAAEK